MSPFLLKQNAATQMMQGVVIHLFGCLHGGHEHITKTLDDDTVDGTKVRRAPVDMVTISHDLRRV